MLDTHIECGGLPASNPLAADVTHNHTPIDFENPHADAMLAAIAISPAARDEFRNLGIGRDIFTHQASRDIASMALAGCSTAELESSDSLNAISPHGRRLIDSLDFRAQALEDETGQIREDWAVADVRRGAKCLACQWLPSILRHVADRLEAGELLIHVIPYLRRWCSLASLESGASHE